MTNSTQVTEDMTNSVKIKARLKKGQHQIKMLFNHPMETGRRKDKLTGILIPEHYIQRILCEHNGRVVMSANWGKGIAETPYLSFWLLDGKIGDTIKVIWIDNRGESNSNETLIS